jgi:hypothetical protein
MYISCRVYLLFLAILRMSRYVYNKYLAGICNGEKNVFSLSEKLKSLTRMKWIGSFNKVHVPQIQTIAVYIHTYIHTHVQLLFDTKVISTCFDVRGPNSRITYMGNSTTSRRMVSHSKDALRYKHYEGILLRPAANKLPFRHLGPKSLPKCLQYKKQYFVPKNLF